MSTEKATVEAPAASAATETAPAVTPAPAAAATAANPPAERKDARSGNHADAWSNTFIVLVESPSAKTVKVEVTPHDCVLDIRHFLLSHPDTCYITSHHLEWCGVKLNDFLELSEYPELFDAGANNVVKMVEDFYDERSARLHVRRLREILVSPPVHYTVTMEPYVEHAQANTKRGTEKKREKVEVNERKLARVEKSSKQHKLSSSEEDEEEEEIQEQPQVDFSISLEDYHAEHSHASPSNAPDFVTKQANIPECVKNITYSAWNPPPGNRLLRGDLLYLEVTTLENNVLHITASVDGFYLNCSTQAKFDPNVAAASYKSRTLVELLKKASPLFASRFSSLMSRKVTRHAFETVPLPVPTYTWINRPAPHTLDWNRAEDALLSTFGMDARGVLREWNEEYQVCRDLPGTSLQERIMRDRTVHRVFSDFLVAALKGAMALVQGSIPPLNPMDAERAHVFLYNNIFYSMAIDGRNMWEGMGGDTTAYKLANHDLMGVAQLAELAIPKLHVLLQCVVNFRGQRVIAQSIVPGIFHDHTSEHLYGSMDNGRTMKRDDNFHKLMTEAAKKLHLKTHDVKDKSGTTVTISASTECKGMSGSDRRCYVLDLFRVFPRDANYPDFKTHPAALIRPEVIKLYCRERAFAKVVQRQEQERKDKEAKTKSAADEKGETKKEEQVAPAAASTEAPASDATAVAAAAPAAEKPAMTAEEENAAYIAELEAINFNPDCFTNATLAGTEEEQKRDEQEVVALAVYLRTKIIPKLINDFLMLTELPIESQSLTELLHERGINMRYLGYIAQLCAKYSMRYMEMLCVREMIARAAKHILNEAIREVRPHKSQKQDHWFVAPRITTFLNSFLGEKCCGRDTSDEELKAATVVLGLLEQQKQEQDKENREVEAITVAVTQNIGASVKKDTVAVAASAETKEEGGDVEEKSTLLSQLLKREKKRSKKKDLASKDSVPRLADGSRAPVDPIAPANLWQRIRNDVKAKFDYDLPPLLHMSQADRLGLLRSLCSKTGVTVACRDYVFNPSRDVPADKRGPFFVDDVIDVYPVLKVHYPKPKDAQDLSEGGKAALLQGNLPQSYAALEEALNVLHQITGPMHRDSAAAYAATAMVFYHAGDHMQAIEHQNRALLIYERVLGADHFETAHAHSNMALVLHTGGFNERALQHAKRALFLFELLCGPMHPHTTAAHMNLATLYQDSGQVALGVQHLQEALKRNRVMLGPVHVQTAVSHHALAVAFSLLGAFRNAINHEKKAKLIYATRLGENHPRVQVCVIWLNWFTKNAVLLAKGRTPTSPTDSMLSPFIWISLRSTLPFRGRMTMSDVLQMIETAARSEEDMKKARRLQEEQERIYQQFLVSIGEAPTGSGNAPMPDMDKMAKALSAMSPAEVEALTQTAMSMDAAELENLSQATEGELPFIPFRPMQQQQQQHAALARAGSTEGSGAEDAAAPQTNGHHHDDDAAAKKKKKRKGKKKAASPVAAAAAH